MGVVVAAAGAEAVEEEAGVVEAVGVAEAVEGAVGVVAAAAGEKSFQDSTAGRERCSVAAPGFESGAVLF